MNRLQRLSALALSGFAALLHLAACGDGAANDDNGATGGSAGQAAGGSAGTFASLGASSGAANQAGGQPSTAGSAGTPATSAGRGGMTSGGASSGGGMSSGAGGTGGMSSGAGGTGGAGGRADNGGSGGSGGTSSGTTCSNITDFGIVSATIVVEDGQVYDGQCRRFRADAETLGDGSQAEDQKPVFIVEGGGKLINVVLGEPAADGIHTKGDVTLENITWEDIGEDALTIKESGTVILNGGSAKDGDDKVFQINAASTFRVSNFKASNAGKFIRQNGDTTFKVEVFIDKCDISDMDEAIFRTDSSTSTVSMTNTRYHAIGDALFLGVSAGNITQSNNTEY
jgi:pectate lyase C